MRVLVYAMPSSGASLFTSFLAQTEDSIAVVDMWSLVPPLRSEFPIIVKVTLDCAIRIEEHYRSFDPGLRILFLRDPRDNYHSLNGKQYREYRGTILEKLAVLDSVFARRAGLFDLVIRYEDFIRDPACVADRIRARGLPLPDNATRFCRGPQQIARFAMDHSEWFRANYRKLAGFGNVHFFDWGNLMTIRYPALPEETLAAIAAACPLVEAHYAGLRKPALGSEAQA